MPAADAEWLYEIGQKRDCLLQDRSPESVRRMTFFLDTHCALVLRNGEEWYDIHPIIREEVEEIVAARNQGILGLSRCGRNCSFRSVARTCRPLYRLEELEGWQLLARHFEIVEGFSFVIVLAPDDWGVALVRERLASDLPSPGCAADSLRSGLAVLSAGRKALGMARCLVRRALWIDTDPGDPDALPRRDDAWREALARLNRYRNTLQARFACTLVLAGPVCLQAILREASPDLWSIRSGVFRISPRRGPCGLGTAAGR